jgi:hypothetical protein
VGGTPAGPFAEVQTGFQASQAQAYAALISGGASPAAAAQTLVQNYHTSVAPFCMVAARGFFSEL